jgi:hypothetical protein
LLHYLEHGSSVPQPKHDGYQADIQGYDKRDHDQDKPPIRPEIFGQKSREHEYDDPRLNHVNENGQMKLRQFLLHASHTFIF